MTSENQSSDNVPQRSAKLGNIFGCRLWSCLLMMLCHVSSDDVLQRAQFGLQLRYFRRQAGLFFLQRIYLL